MAFVTCGLAVGGGSDWDTLTVATVCVFKGTEPGWDERSEIIVRLYSFGVVRGLREALKN